MRDESCEHHQGIIIISVGVWQITTPVKLCDSSRVQQGHALHDIGLLLAISCSDWGHLHLVLGVPAGRVEDQGSEEAGAGRVDLRE